MDTLSAIAANQRRSTLLITVLLVLLGAIGGAIGYAVMGTQNGLLLGVGGGAVVFAVMMFINMRTGESALLKSANARQVGKADAPELYGIVESLAQKASLPVVPKVYVIETDVPNAFAVGLKPERACVAVTTALASRLDREELRGVLAHEMGHIANRDTVFMTMAGVTMGGIVLMANYASHSMAYSAGVRRGRGRSSGGAGALFVLLGLAVSLLAPICARLLYFACSREREYLADATAAEFTSNPAALASALQKISSRQNPKSIPHNGAVNPLYIINPLAASGSSNIFGTHPPTEERIRRLLAMR